MALFAQSVFRERHAREVFANVVGSRTLRQGFRKFRFMPQRSAYGTTIDPLPELRIVLKVPCVAPPGLSSFSASHQWLTPLAKLYRPCRGWPRHVIAVEQNRDA